MKKEYEIRQSKNYEIRAVEKEGRKTIECVIPYNSMSEDIGFKEVLRPGCFSRSIKNGTDIKALYQHKDENILGRIKNQSLVLEDTKDSLRAIVYLPNTSLGDEVFTLINEGYITNCSFGFRAIQEEWNDQENIRTILEAHLIEISPVTFPAYNMTSAKASLRSLRSLGIDNEKLVDALESDNKEEILNLLKPLYNSVSKSEEDNKPVIDDTLFQTELLKQELELMKAAI